MDGSQVSLNLTSVFIGLILQIFLKENIKLNDLKKNSPNVKLSSYKRY